MCTTQAVSKLGAKIKQVSVRRGRSVANTKPSFEWTAEKTFCCGIITQNYKGHFKWTKNGNGSNKVIIKDILFAHYFLQLSCIKDTKIVIFNVKISGKARLSLVSYYCDTI